MLIGFAPHSSVSSPYFFQNGYTKHQNGIKNSFVQNNEANKIERGVESFEDTPLYIAVLTYLGYAILILFGHFRDLLRKWKLEKVPMASEPLKTVSILQISINY